MHGLCTCIAFSYMTDLFDQNPGTKDIVCIRKGKDVYVKTKVAIPKGKLCLPLIVKSVNSIVPAAVAASAGSTHPHAMKLDVQWLVSEDERQLGIEEDFHKISLIANPDWLIPSRKANSEKLEWDQKVAPYLFWAIQRQKAIEDKVNCTVVSRSASLLFQL